jgi:hypothetical protein
MWERSWKVLVSSALSVAVMEKRFEGCGTKECFFRSGCSASEGDGVRGASIAVERTSLEHTVGDRSWKVHFSAVFSVAIMIKCFEACG